MDLIFGSIWHRPFELPALLCHTNTAVTSVFDVTIPDQFINRLVHQPFVQFVVREWLVSPYLLVQHDHDLCVRQSRDFGRLYLRPFRPGFGFVALTWLWFVWFASSLPPL